MFLKQGVGRVTFFRSKCWLVGWLVGDHLLVRNFGPDENIY
jgi:hypothetical protein